MIVFWVAVSVFAYRHVIGDLLHQWRSNPSYSHGPIVIPIAVWLLWLRWSSRPSVSKPWSGAGGLLLAAHVLLWLGGYFYVPAVARWSLPFWIAGMVGLMCGRRTLVWSLPAIGFLAFMIPIPFQLESLTNQTLQWASAWCSCLLLSLTSTVAVTDGYTLRMPSGRLGVTADCSGLRMTIAIAAVGYVLAFLRHPWNKDDRCGCASLRVIASQLGMMLLLVIPAAILANAARITAMAWVMDRYQWEPLTAWAHDLGDLLVLPVAAAVFLSCRTWLGKAIQVSDREVESRCLGHRDDAPGRRWGIQFGSPIRLAMAPTALVALAGFAVWQHHVQRERIAAVVMAKARGYEVDSDWERAAECYRDLAHWQTSPVEANYRQVCVSLQAASSRDDRRQAFLQLKGILQRAPLHVGVLRTYLNLALELDMADAALQSAERLYLIDRHQATTLQMCAETRLRFASEPSALPAITAESLSSWIDRLGQVSTWRDDLVIEVAAICCQQPDAVDRSLVNAIQVAICDVADRQQTARAHFASWQFEHAFGGRVTSLERARGCLDEDCPHRVAYEIYLASAKQAWQASEPDEAKAFAVAAIREISTDHRSYELLGDVYESQREWGRCAAAYLRAWRLAGDRPLEIGIKLAESLVRVGRHSESSSLAGGLVRQVDDPLISPDRRLRIRLRLVQAQLDVRAERFEAALQELQRCNALAKLLPPEADSSGELLSAIEVLRAQCLVRLGRYADAARLFEVRAGRVDSPAEQWTAAARAWTKGGNVSAAERCYRRAVAESANDPRVWLEYVQHLKASRGIDEAVAEVTKRQGRVGLEAPVSDRSLAQAWEIGLLQRVVAAEPHNVVVANNLAMLLADEAKEFEQALQCIDRVLERTGPVAEFLDTKGWILVQMDRAAEAIPWLTEAMARASSADPVAQLHLAAAYMVTGDRDRAREYLESAKGGRLRAELLNASEQHAWQALQREFSPQLLTSLGGEA